VSNEEQRIPPMEDNRVWALVELSGGDAEQLKTILLTLPAEDICAFSLTLDDLMRVLDRRDIHDMTDGFDDGCEYMRLWIISRGRAYCESVAADPHNAPRWGGAEEENEMFGYAPEDAYKAKVGSAFPAAIRQRRNSRFFTGISVAGCAASDRDECCALNEERELVQDLLSIVHVFSARLYDLPSYQKVIRDAAMQKDQAPGE
jgi:hypothetical protein